MSIRQEKKANRLKKRNAIVGLAFSVGLRGGYAFILLVYLSGRLLGNPAITPNTPKQIKNTPQGISMKSQTWCAPIFLSWRL